MISVYLLLDYLFFIPFYLSSFLPFLSFFRINGVKGENIKNALLSFGRRAQTNYSRTISFVK